MPGFLLAQASKITVTQIDNSIFKKDKYWRGADGAATVKLPSGKILWLFSDSFIDQNGKGKRSDSRKMIRNSIAVQDSGSLTSKLTYYYKGTRQEPEDFFKVPGNSWFWTGQGIYLEDKLVIFLMEEIATNSGIGFEAIGWYVAMIDNPSDNPLKWIIHYIKGPKTFGVIVGSSAVLQDTNYVYAFGVKEPATHETYLLRFDTRKFVKGDLSAIEWWNNHAWTDTIKEEPKSSSLFIGQTEFSVHYEQKLQRYIQIQTYGFGKASIGFRLSDKLYGPWSDPVIFYTPPLKEEKEFVYTARAHPEFSCDGIVVTYNINNSNFKRLMSNEEIYFPKIIKLNLSPDY